MMFMLEREKDTISSVQLDQRERGFQIKRKYQQGLQLGIPPRFIQPPQTDVENIQPHDILQLNGIEALENISYNQEQLDFINYHAIAIREALTPVISAFAPTPQDMGIVMNFCT